VVGLRVLGYVAQQLPGQRDDQLVWFAVGLRLYVQRHVEPTVPRVDVGGRLDRRRDPALGERHRMQSDVSVAQLGDRLDDGLACLHDRIAAGAPGSLRSGEILPGAQQALKHLVVQQLRDPLARPVLGVECVGHDPPPLVRQHGHLLLGLAALDRQRERVRDRLQEGEVFLRW
jgi:hypothetical protein